MPLLTDIGWGWVFLTAILAGAIIAVTEIELGLPGKWVFLAVETVLLFAVLIQLNRGLRRTPKFWAVMAALLVLHLVGLVSLLLRVDRWPGSMWGLVFGGEFIGANIILAALLTPSSDR